MANNNNGNNSNNNGEKKEWKMTNPCTGLKPMSLREIMVGKKEEKKE